MRIMEIRCPSCSGTFNLYEPSEYIDCYSCGRKLSIDGSEVSLAEPGADPGFEELLAALYRDGVSESMELCSEFAGSDSPSGLMVDGLMTMIDPVKGLDTDEAISKAEESWEQAFSAMESDYYLDQYMELIGMAVAAWADNYGADVDDQAGLFKPLEGLVRNRFSKDYYSAMYRSLCRGICGYIDKAEPSMYSTHMLEIFALEYAVSDPDYSMLMERCRAVVEYIDSHPGLPYTNDIRPLYNVMIGVFREMTKDLTDADRIRIADTWDYTRMAFELGVKVSDANFASIMSVCCTEEKPSLMDRMLHPGKRLFVFNANGCPMKEFVPADTRESPSEYFIGMMKSSGHEDMNSVTLEDAVRVYAEAYLNP